MCRAARRENVRSFAQSALLRWTLKFANASQENRTVKRSVACLAILLTSTCASACPMLKALVDRYGISEAGFLLPIPLAKANADPAFLRMTLPTSDLVSDGFEHTVFIDRKGKLAWVRRTGGFARVRAWYGPVEIGAHSLAGCRDDAQVRREKAAVASKEFMELDRRQTP